MPLVKSVDSLETGMTVSRDVDVRGTVLLKAGTLITDAHIRQLQKWGVTTVSISSPQELGGDAILLAEDSERNLQEKQRLEQLFSTTGDDKQMQTLKLCLLRHIEGQ